MDISFVSAVYNKAQFLDRNIWSFIKLSKLDLEFEVIYVDDCSTDDSLNIIKEYENEYNFIKVISMEQNSGSPSEPRNRGMKLAAGEYIAIIDADDWIEPLGIKNLTLQMKKHHADVGFGQSFKHSDKKTHKIARFSSYKKDNDLQPHNIKNIFRALGPPGKIFKKSLIEENGIYFREFKYGEDKLFFAEVIARAKSASMTDETVYHVDRYPENFSLVKQTDIRSRAPMNLSIAEEIITLDINERAKDLILERIVEADFIRGLLYRKEFYQAKDTTHYIDIIDQLKSLFLNNGLDIEDYINDSLLSNIYYLYKNDSNENLVRYVKSNFLQSSLRIVGNKVEFPNNSGVSVPNIVYKNAHFIFSGTQLIDGKYFESVECFCIQGQAIKAVGLMEKANEENFRFIPFHQNDKFILINPDDMGFSVREYNIAVILEYGEIHLVHASYPHSGKSQMKRQYYKLEYSNPKGTKTRNQFYSSKENIEEAWDHAKVLKKVQVYANPYFQSDDIVKIINKNEIFEIERILSLEDGGKAFKVRGSGYVKADSSSMTVSYIEEDESIVYRQKPEYVIALKYLQKRSKRRIFQKDYIVEGEKLRVNSLKTINGVQYFTIEGYGEYPAKKNLFKKFRKRDMTDYIIKDVSKVKVKKRCYLYPDRNFINDAIEPIQPGRSFDVECIVYNDNSIPRIKTLDGEFLTSNRDFVEILR